MCKFEEKEKNETVVREWKKIKIRVSGIVMRRERKKERDKRKKKYRKWKVREREEKREERGEEERKK